MHPAIHETVPRYKVAQPEFPISSHKNNHLHAVSKKYTTIWEMITSYMG